MPAKTMPKCNSFYYTGVRSISSCGDGYCYIQIKFKGSNYWMQDHACSDTSGSLLAMPTNSICTGRPTDNCVVCRSKLPIASQLGWPTVNGSNYTPCTPPCPSPVAACPLSIPGYTFHLNKDGWGPWGGIVDLARITNGSNAWDLATECSARADCIAFLPYFSETEGGGYLKGKVPPQWQWTPWGPSDCKGLFVKGEAGCGQNILQAWCGALFDRCADPSSLPGSRLPSRSWLCFLPKSVIGEFVRFAS